MNKEFVQMVYKKIFPYAIIFTLFAGFCGGLNYVSPTEGNWFLLQMMSSNGLFICAGIAVALLLIAIFNWLGVKVQRPRIMDPGLPIKLIMAGFLLGGGAYAMVIVTADEKDMFAKSLMMTMAVLVAFLFWLAAFYVLGTQESLSTGKSEEE